VPNINYNQYSSTPTTNPLAPLQQDCFVKSEIPAEILGSSEQIGEIYQAKLAASYSSSSISQMQAKLREKERALEFNKKQLSRYPDNPKYGREIEKLEKEIKELKREISKAC